MARPTLYNDEVLAKANDYLVNYKDEGHAVPSVAGLGKILRITRETLYKWAKDEDKKEFSDTLAQIISDQEFELVNGGLMNELNSNIAKLMLYNHGHKEKQDVTSNDEGIGGLFQVELVSAKKD